MSNWRNQVPFLHALSVRIGGDNGVQFHPYMESENCTMIPLLQEPGRWLMRCRYYGRGSRNIQEGVCFQEVNNRMDLNTLNYTNHYVATRPSVHLEFTLDGDHLGVVEVPLDAHCIRQEFPDLVMPLDIPINVGNRLQLLSLSLRDIRSTPDYEICGIEFYL
jgi:hypothetical protein